MLAYFFYGFFSALILALIFYYFFFYKPLAKISNSIDESLDTEVIEELQTSSNPQIVNIAKSLFGLLNKIEEVERLRKDFVANVSHELKTPITSVKGFVETLLDGAMYDEVDLKRFLKIISQQADRLSEIVEDLLTLARLEAEPKTESLYLQEVLISDLFLSVYEFCKNQAELKQIKIKITCDKALRATVDRRLIEQAITNLLDNAIKYSSEGGTVLLKAKKINSKLEILVSDQGMGIASEHLPRIFQRFYRVDKARSRLEGGTGLGLAIVKHIINTHSGKISVNSRLGEGTEFKISI